MSDFRTLQSNILRAETSNAAWDIFQAGLRNAGVTALVHGFDQMGRIELMASDAEWLRAYESHNRQVFSLLKKKYFRTRRPVPFGPCLFAAIGFNDQHIRLFLDHQHRIGRHGLMLLADNVTTPIGGGLLLHLDMTDAAFDTWCQTNVDGLPALFNLFHTHHQRLRRREIPITGRQIDCLNLLASGLGSAQIGHTLGISERTVNAHLTQARKRLNADTREQAVAIVTANGWLE